MSDKNKEPIDLLERRVEKLLQQEKEKEEAQGTRQELGWSGERFASEVESIELSEETLKGIKTFICTIAQKVKEAASLDEVERPCFGLALLLLRDYDQEAFNKLLEMMKKA